MILSTSEIHREYREGGIKINPFNILNLGSNSYDVRLSELMLTYTDTVLDAKRNNPYEVIEIPKEGFVLQPGKLYLGSTIETVSTDKYVQILEGRSSIARLGVSVHLSAGFGDVGFSGTWTLEITSVQPVRIYHGMRIAQIAFLEFSGNPLIYNKKYQNQKLPRASKSYEDFEK